MTQVKVRDLKWEEAALTKRLEFIQSLKIALQQEDSLVGLTVDEYSKIIDELIYEVCLDVHKAVKTGADDLGDLKRRHNTITETTNTTTTIQPDKPLGGNSKQQKQKTTTTPTAPTATTKGAVDMFGNTYQPIALDQVVCPSCGRSLAAGRFAPHLDKCIMRGRQASRNAKRLTEIDDI